MFKLITLVICSILLAGCVAGPLSYAVDRKVTTTYHPNGNIASKTDEHTINQSIAKSTLSAGTFLASGGSLPGAIVAGSSSVSDAFGSFAKRTGDTVSNTMDQMSAQTIGTPKPIPSESISNEVPEEQKTMNIKVVEVVPLYEKSISNDKAITGLKKE